MKHFRLLPLLAAFAVSASATTIEYSPAQASAPLRGIGNGYADTYDVAMYLDGAEFAGAKVSEFSVPLISKLNGTEVKLWIGSKLALDGKSPVTDIFSTTATVADGRAKALLPQALQIPSSGLYIGYSFTIKEVTDDSTADPVQVRNAFAHLGGLYVHASKIYTSWTDLAAQRDVAADITVTMDAPVDAANMSITAKTDDLNVFYDAESAYEPVMLVNYGKSDVSDIEYTITFNGGTSTTRNHAPEKKMLYGQAYELDLHFPNMLKKGDNTVDFTIEKIDGATNTNTSKSFVQNVFCYSENIPKYPLLEEYTGLWCNYCPAGYAAMEYMNRVHPDDYIGVAFHYNDKMAIAEKDEFPSPVPSAPYSYMDREWDLDPYYGFRNTPTIEDDWKIKRAEFTPAALELAATKDEDGKVSISAHSHFIKDMPSECRIFYYLVANGLTDPTWTQHNSYGGYDPKEFTMPEMEQFCTSGTRVTGLVFNDIVVMMSDPHGVTKSYDGNPEADRMYTHSYSFDTAGMKSLKGDKLIEKATSLHVVAGIVDTASGKILNAAKCPVTDSAGIEESTDDISPVVRRDYYDLYGRRANENTRGILIEKTTRADGTTSTSKMVKR